MASAQFPAVGQCMVLTGGFPYGLGSMGAGLDAGFSLMLTGAAGTHTLQQTSKGEYQASFGASVTGPDVPLGTY